MSRRPMQFLSPKNSRQKGAALILLTMMLVIVVIPMIGLAIDGGMSYLVQTRLSASCDAAALAGARSLSVGLDLASQMSSAQATITEYLQSDFPNGLYQTSNLNITSSITETSYKTRTISVNATVTYPTFFMSLIGFPRATVAAAAQTSRRDANIMLVLDRSGSIQQAGVCGTLIASAQDFADKFTNGRDRLGLITFTAVPGLDYAPTVDFKSASPSLDDVLGQLQCGGNTGSAHALWMAYQQLVSINEPGALNLIVFFTDGIPNGVSAVFPVKTMADTRYSPTSTSTSTKLPASGCAATTITGAIAQGAPLTTATTGYTTGIFSLTPPPISQTTNLLVASQGCAYPSSDSGISMRDDVAYIPPTDINGNATTGYKTVAVFSSGSYKSDERPDMPVAVTAASQNAADNAASRIRADTNLVPVIYSIGLGGTSVEPLDQVFLQRVANDPQSPIFSTTEPPGMFVYASDATQLDQAFMAVASQILRISK